MAVRVSFRARMTTNYALFLLLLALGTMGAVPVQARDWLVPEQAPTIQAAIDSCVTGDVVVIAPGIYSDCTQYSENVYHIAVLKPGVSLRGSTGDPADVILDAGFEGRCLEIRDGGGEMVIEAITLRRGKAVSPFGKGGAVFSIFSEPVFRSCVFDSNQADFGGAAISASYGSLVVEDCLFTDNSTPGIGAAVQVSQAPATITGTTIHGSSGSGVHYATEAITLENTIISGGDGASITRNNEQDPLPELSCCDFFGNEEDYPDFVAGLEDTAGNISLDPLYCNPLFGDFQLYAISPCAGENSGDCGRIGAYAAACGFGAVTWILQPDGSGDFPSIQDAVNAAVAGDTIALDNGTYSGAGNRDIDLLGKELTIKGLAGDPDLAVIDCQGTPEEPHRAFLFQNQETQFTVIRDLTITGGESSTDGGAIYCASSPRIENVVFDHNGADRGGAIFVQGGDPTIIGCTFAENRGDSRAGGIALVGSEAQITDCLFTANWGYIGSAVFLPDSSAVVLEGCTITGNNSSLDKDCLGVDGNSSLSIRHCNVTFNSRHAVRDYGDGSVTVVNSNIFGNAEGDYDGPIAGQINGNGNLSADPLYCDPDSRNFTLRSDSPCTPNSAPDGVLIGAFGVGCEAPPIFSDQSQALPLSDAVSAGVSVMDLNGDGLLDFMVANNGQPNEVLIGDGTGQFQSFFDHLLALAAANTRQTAWADFDNDGDLDVYLANSGLINFLARNTGDLIEMVEAPQLAGAGRAGASSWADYDGDGNLDLFLASLDSTSVLLKGDGLGGFTELADAVFTDLGGITSSAWADYDNDGDQDLYLMRSAAENLLLENDGSFGEVTGSALNLTGTNGSAAWGDYDNDGKLDLFLARDGQPSALFRNQGGGTFSNEATGPLSSSGSVRTGIWGDWDNDGDLDLFVARCGQPDQLLRNEGSGRFVDTADAVFAQPDSSTGAAFGDFDQDGDLDLVVAVSSGQTRFVRNDQNTGHNWFQLRLTRLNGQAASPGARISLTTDLGQTQIREMGGRAGLSGRSPTAHFGLGVADTIRYLEVSWPGGQTRGDSNLTVNQLLEWTEPQPDDELTPVEDLPGRETTLWPARPNPFNPRTILTFSLKRPSPVTLDIYDLRGRRIKRLRKGFLEAGRHEATWAGRDARGRLVAAGVYLVRLKAGQEIRTQGITLLK